LEANLFGFVLYLLVIFIPGLGVGELVGAWKVDDGLIERLGMAFAIGISIDALWLFVRTSGFGFAGFVLVGVNSTSALAPIVIGVVALAISFALRRKFTLRPRWNRFDLVVMLVLLVQISMLMTYYQSYPIFPQYPSGDFVQHVILTTSLVSGSATSFPAGVLYFGIHYQLATALVLVGGEPLITIRYTMAILAVLSSLLFYLVASKLFSSRKIALMTTVFYALSATVWFGTIYNAGLYANFYGMLASVFLIVAFAEVVRAKSYSSWSLFIIALLNGYLSHYSTVTLLAAFLALIPLQAVLARKHLKGISLPALAAVCPSAAVVLAYPAIIQILLSAATVSNTTGQLIVGTTPLASLLVGFPALSFVATEVTDDIATLALLFFAAVYIFRIRGSRYPLTFLPIIWFIILLATAPFNTTAWRFAFEAIVPLTLMAGYGAASLVPRLRLGLDNRAILGVVVVVIVLSPVLIGSWGTQMVQAAQASGPVFPLDQEYVYQGISWLKSNTPPHANFLSVSDWRFTYTLNIAGKRTYYQYTADPAQAIQFAKLTNSSYIIATNYVTENLPPNPNAFPWNTYPGGTNLTLVYSNPDVKVFKVA
jgi:hypothetical protein